MKLLPLCFVATVFLLTSATSAQDGSGPPAMLDAQPPFLEPGKWWNLFFADGNDPLGAIKAVKIVRVSDTHPSWVQIAFPKIREEHFSLFGPAAKAHDDPSIKLEAAIAEWERSVTEWRIIWINLDFVVHMSAVERSHATEPTIDGASSPPGR